MGDYTKVIVNCAIKKIDENRIEGFRKEFLDKAYLCSSAYHCGGELLEIDNDWHHRSDITFVTQLKYGRGLEEFIEWLKPLVIQGMGENDAFALVFSEYQKEPTLYYMEDNGLE